MKKFRYNGEIKATSLVNFEVVPCHVRSSSKVHGNSTDDNQLVCAFSKQTSNIITTEIISVYWPCFYVEMVWITSYNLFSRLS